MVVRDTNVYFDPYDVSINADPYPTYERLREEAPIYFNERYDFWALARHEDVQKALVNWEVFSSSRGDLLDVLRAGIEIPTGVVMWEDPPVHTTHRGLLSRVLPRNGWHCSKSRSAPTAFAVSIRWLVAKDST